MFGYAELRNKGHSNLNWIILLLNSIYICFKVKNEDKIVEILAESLKKQDQMAEILRGQAKTLWGESEILSKQSTMLMEQGEKLDTVVDVIKDMAEAVRHNTNVVEKVVS